MQDHSDSIPVSCWFFLTQWPGVSGEESQRGAEGLAPRKQHCRHPRSLLFPSHPKVQTVCVQNWTTRPVHLAESVETTISFRICDLGAPSGLPAVWSQLEEVILEWGP